MGLVGNLKDLSITNIIELNCVEKSTAQVIIKTRTGDAMVFFHGGNIVHARWGDLKGTEALYHILRLAEGEFRVTSDITLPERTIYESWKGLVLEGMRVYDETRQTKDRLVRDLADELTRLPGLSRVLAVAKNGTLVHHENRDDAERAYALSAFLAAQGAALSDTLHLGPLDHVTYARGKQRELIFDCDPFLVLLALERAADVRPVQALIETIRARLKSSDTAPAPEEQTEQGARL